MISLLVLLAVLVSSNLIECRKQQSLTCPATTQCECIKNGGLEIQCPRTEPRHLFVRIMEPHNHVSFECENLKNGEFEMLPNIPVEESKSLKFSGCPLPQGKPFATYLKNIRIERVLSLLFVSNGNNGDIQFESQFFEGMADLERFELLGLKNEIRKLPADFFQSTKKLTRVKISVPNIHLPVGLFASLDNLTELDLSGNNLQNITPGLLQNLNKLEVSNLWRNALRSLDKNLFFGLTSVTDLGLSSNELESLDADVFYHLISLTSIDLSANRFSALPEGLFANNAKLKKFYLLENRVPLETLPNDLFTNLTELENVSIKCNLRTIPESIFSGSPKIGNIILRNNALEVLPKDLLRDQSNLKTLDLSGNAITQLDDDFFARAKQLKELYLSRNRLTKVSNNLLASLGSLVKLHLELAGNPWNCKCENKKFLLFAQKSKKIISDYSQMKCAEGISFNELNVGDLCSSVNTFIIVISCIAAFMGIVLGAFFGFYYKYEKQIKMWLYSHDMCLWFVTEEELDKDKLYDAFISYSHKDCDFVSEKLVPKLESLNYELCVHERDWLPGVEITTQISNSVNDAKRTIIVMSPNFLESNWAQWEFQVAQSHAATEKRSRIIVILYGDIGDVDKLEPDIRDYLKLNTYVKWGDKWFWQKLQYAMPHCKANERFENTDGSELIEIRDRNEEL